VHLGVLVGLHHYGGSPSVVPDVTVVNKMIDELVRSNQAPIGFALDVGIVADSGNTAVVEMNEGFALGRYGLDPAKYFDLIAARWIELTTSSRDS
jgi:ATP-grasp domain, R2K clade family 2